MNLTRNQYFITKLLAGMKKDWASWDGRGEKEALDQLDVEDGMIHGAIRPKGGGGCGDNKGGFWENGSSGVFTADLGIMMKMYRN